MAIDAGQLDFGENYVQEAQQKTGSINNNHLNWHFIGPVQSNKTRLISGLFHWVHSIDRYRVAKRLSESRSADMPSLNICLQVNISMEASKSGVTTEELPDLIEACSQLPQITVRGLMTMPEPTDNFSEQRKAFRTLRQAQEHLINAGYSLDTLSMGTSNDFRAAIAEGSTMIRIGTAIFGPRS